MVWFVYDLFYECIKTNYSPCIGTRVIQKTGLNFGDSFFGNEYVKHEQICIVLERRAY